MAKRPRLTIALHKRITAGILSGGFPHVAARTWGVTQETLEDWLFRGRGRRAREPYASFAREVDEAEARARLLAERHIYDEEKDFALWLQYGPGRERPGKPGWARLASGSDAAPWEGNVFTSPEIMRAMTDVCDALAEHPALQTHVATILSSASKAAGNERRG